MKLSMKKLSLIVLAGALTVGMSMAAFAMPGDVGGTWNGYDNYNDWYFSIHGTYPPDDDGDDSDGSSVGEVTDVWWHGSEARWDFDGNCRRFEVRLYRDGDHVDTERTSHSRYDFSSDMDQAGDYTFEVRAIYGSQRSDWSDESDEHHVDRDYNNNNNNYSNSGSGVVSAGPGASSAGQWIEQNGRWWYRHSNGSYTTNNWEQINGRWYFFDGSGWMVTGWIHWNGGTYYCLNDGAMVTGDAVIDGRTCHFNGSGALQ